MRMKITLTGAPFDDELTQRRPCTCDHIMREHVPKNKVGGM